MKLIPTTEQLQIAEMLRELFTENCTPDLVKTLKDPSSSGVAESLWTKLAEVGVFGMAVSEDNGGSAASLSDLGIVFSEGGRALCPTNVYSTLQFAVALARLASPEQQGRYLPALADGEVRASLAIANPADAGDIRPQLTAEHTRGHWTLNGTLSFLAHAETSDVILVTAAHRSLSHAEQVIGFLITPDVPGFSAQPLRTISGDKLYNVTLDNVRVDEAEALTGVRNEGLQRPDLQWTSFACLSLQCMEMVGGAAHALEHSVEYVKVRQQFGRPLGAFQAAQHILADVQIANDAARLSAAQSLYWHDRLETASPRMAAIAKMQSSEAYKWATLNGHQVQGGMGYVRETDFHLWSERAKSTEILGGTADVAAGWLQRELGLSIAS